MMLCYWIWGVTGDLGYRNLEFRQTARKHFVVFFLSIGVFCSCCLNTSAHLHQLCRRSSRTVCGLSIGMGVRR